MFARQICRSLASRVAPVARARAAGVYRSLSTEAGSAFGEELPPPSSPAWTRFTSALTFSGIALCAGYGYMHYKYDVPDVERYVKALQEEGPADSFWLQAAQEYLTHREYIEEKIRFYADPSSDKLLPDLPENVAPHVRTLVLDLDELLVYSDWTRERGWRTFKRPGADIFLAHMAQLFEVIVYTDQMQTYADPILDKLDPDRVIAHRLYRDATRYKEGEHVRDIGALNRDPAKIVYLSAKPASYTLQPENALPMKAWTKDPQDRELLDHMPFLEAIARKGPPDTRDVLNSFLEEAAVTGKDVPAIYKERMQGHLKKVVEKQRAKTGGGRSFAPNYSKPRPFN